MRDHKDETEGMSKYGVEERTCSVLEKEKMAARGCPKCGTPADRLVKHGTLVTCPNCGSEPWE